MIHGFMEWQSLNYANHELTVYPEVRVVNIPDDGHEYRTCKGKHCLYGAFKHRIEKMWYGKMKNGQNFYICDNCKQSYSGKIKLERYVKDEGE